MERGTLRFSGYGTASLLHTVRRLSLAIRPFTLDTSPSTATILLTLKAHTTLLPSSKLYSVTSTITNNLRGI